MPKSGENSGRPPLRSRTRGFSPDPRPDQPIKGRQDGPGRHTRENQAQPSTPAPTRLHYAEPNRLAASRRREPPTTRSTPLPIALRASGGSPAGNPFKSGRNTPAPTTFPPALIRAPRPEHAGTTEAPPEPAVTRDPSPPPRTSASGPLIHASSVTSPGPSAAIAKSHANVRVPRVPSVPQGFTASEGALEQRAGVQPSAVYLALANGAALIVLDHAHPLTLAPPGVTRRAETPRAARGGAATPRVARDRGRSPSRRPERALGPHKTWVLTSYQRGIRASSPSSTSSRLPRASPFYRLV